MLIVATTELAPAGRVSSYGAVSVRPPEFTTVKSTPAAGSALEKLSSIVCAVAKVALPSRVTVSSTVAPSPTSSSEMANSNAALSASVIVTVAVALVPGLTPVGKSPKVSAMVSSPSISASSPIGTETVCRSLPLLKTTDSGTLYSSADAVPPVTTIGMVSPKVPLGSLRPTTTEAVAPSVALKLSGVNDTLTGASIVYAAGTTDSIAPSAVQMPPEAQALVGEQPERDRVVAVRRQREQVGVRRLTRHDVGSDTGDGRACDAYRRVSAAKSTTGSLKATTTVGVSLWPKLKTEVCALSGQAAASGSAGCSSTSKPRG